MRGGGKDGNGGGVEEKFRRAKLNSLKATEKERFVESPESLFNSNLSASTIFVQSGSRLNSIINNHSLTRYIDYLVFIFPYLISILAHLLEVNITVKMPSLDNVDEIVDDARSKTIHNIS